MLAGTPRTEAFAFSGPNREALTRELARIADLAPLLSDGELHDLACHTGRKTGHGLVRAGLAASSQDQLSSRARDAMRLLDGLPQKRLATAPGLFAADRGTGRVVLLFPGEASPIAALPGSRGGFEAGTYDPSLQPAIMTASLAGLRWLGRLGVEATAGVGHGVGEITGLVWAGCLSEPDVARLVAQRGMLLAAPAAHRTALVCVDTDTETAQRLCAGTSLVIAAYNGPRCHVLAGPESAISDIRQRLAEQGTPVRRLESPHAFYSPAMSDRVAPLRSILRELAFRPPTRRLISTVTGAELTANDDIMLVLCKQLMSPVRFTDALNCVRAGADLLVETGPGHVLSHFAADCCDVPAVSLAGPRADDEATALVAAALFAAGAVNTLAPVLSGRPGRPIDIWRERTFISRPAGTSARGEVGLATATPGKAGLATATPGKTGPGTATPGKTGPTTAVPGQSAAPADASTAAGSQEAGRRAPAVLRRLPPDPGEAVAGVGPWVRCFTEDQRAAKPPQSPEAERRWRLRTATSEPLGKIAMRVFPDDPSAKTVVAVLGGLTEPGTCATLLDSAREAVAAGRLVLIATEHSVTGFGASLRAENPALGVTVIKAAPTLEGLEGAKRFAVATPGLFREVVLGETGGAVEPAMVPAVPGAAGTFPLGPADVVLVSGMTSLGDLACATALASRGAALAVLAPPGREDPRLAACLADLRAAGTRVSRKKAELTDPAQVAVAVRSLERGLGPVTAVVHAAVPGPTERSARLSESALRGCLISQERRFSSVLAAVAPERLRVLVTFGSITARYGAPGGACEGLAGGLLAEQARRWVAGLARCRALHVDWAPWAEPHAVGSDPGAAMTVSVADGSRMLITMLTTPDLPHRVAVHGRLGVPGALASPASEATPALPTSGATPALPTGGAALAMRGRFLDTVRVHYPGVELVVDTRLSLRADPYLNDYRIDGLPILPASMILEAMAEAASALAGAPQRHVTGVRVAFPVVVTTSEAVIRVCALRRGDTVETVLRCAGTGFRVDHARAMFGDARAPRAVDIEAATRPAEAGVQRADSQQGVADAGSKRANSRQRVANTGAEPPTQGGRAQHTRRQDEADMPGGIVDGTDLYGHVHFQAGQFRRIAFLPEVSSRGCRALVRGGDTKPWFGAVSGPVDVPMILGSPGLNDACVQVLQACLPHRRLLVVSCESVTFSGEEARGAVEVQAVRRPTAGSEAASTASGSWDVRAIDAAGQPLADWVGVTLRDLGPLAPTDGWHPTLLAAALEARAAQLGIDTTLRASISCGRHPVTVPRKQGELSLPQPRSAGNAAGEAAPPGDTAGETAPPANTTGETAPPSNTTGETAPPGDAAGEAAPRSGSWSDRAVGRGPLDGFELTVRGALPVACRWQAVGSRPKDDSNDEELGRLRNQLRACLPETVESVEARLDTLAACLVALGREPGTPCVLEDACASDWIVVRSSGVVAGCAIAQISGVPATVAVSIASRVTAATPMRATPPGPPLPADPPVPQGPPFPPIAPGPLAEGQPAQRQLAPGPLTEGQPGQGQPAQGEGVSAQGPPPIRRNAVLPLNCASSALRFPRLVRHHGRSKQTACRFTI